MRLFLDHFAVSDGGNLYLGFRDGLRGLYEMKINLEDSEAIYEALREVFNREEGES